MIKERGQFLEWNFENETIDDIGTGAVIYERTGKNALSTDTWNHKRVYKPHEKFEETTNKGSNEDGDWVESWKRQDKESWAVKVGVHQSSQWKEQWYRRIKEYSKKKDEETGAVVLNPDTGSEQYESDGSQVEESNCEKWGRNEQSNEEWTEKWGEIHRAGEKQKWCEKW